MPEKTDHSDWLFKCGATHAGHAGHVWIMVFIFVCIALASASGLVFLPNGQ